MNRWSVGSRSYRVLQPERATLSLVRSGSNRWEMGELKASYNRPVSDSTSELVEQWLKDWNLSEVKLADPWPRGAI